MAGGRSAPVTVANPLGWSNLGKLVTTPVFDTIEMFALTMLLLMLAIETVVSWRILSPDGMTSSPTMNVAEWRTKPKKMNGGELFFATEALLTIEGNVMDPLYWATTFTCCVQEISTKPRKYWPQTGGHPGRYNVLQSRFSPSFGASVTS